MNKSIHVENIQITKEYSGNTYINVTIKLRHERITNVSVTFCYNNSSQT